jgi:hypothetical protein
MLFKLIDVNFFFNIFFDNKFTPIVLSTTIFFMIYGTISKKELIFNKLLSALSSFQIFLELISSFLILFMIFLPIMGPQKIFNTGYSSVIMLSLNIIGLVLIQFINFENIDISKFRKWLITSYVLLEPIFSILAMYSMFLRINQYGFSPQRFIAFIIILLFTIFNFSYFYAVIKYKLDWKTCLNKQTPYLVIISVFILFLTITPILNPYEISVKSQISRYGNNIEKLDLLSLKFKLSKPGKEAFKEIKKKYKDDKKAMLIIEKVDKCSSYWNCDDVHHATANKYIEPKIVFNIYPKGAKEPDNFKSLMNKYYSSSSYYQYSHFIIKDLIQEYNGEEIIVVNYSWIMGKQLIYQAIFVKNQKNEYELLNEHIFRGKNFNSIDFENIELIKEDNYKIKF